MENNLTMDSVARIVGVAKSTYAGYESEFRQPSLEKITMFADFYKASVDYILCLTDQRERTGSKEGFNTKDLLTKDELHWDGIPLNEEEMKQIKDFLKTMEEKNKRSKTDEKFG